MGQGGRLDASEVGHLACAEDQRELDLEPKPWINGLIELFHRKACGFLSLNRPVFWACCSVVPHQFQFWGLLQPRELEISAVFTAQIDDLTNGSRAAHARVHTGRKYMQCVSFCCIHMICIGCANVYVYDMKL